MAFLTEPEPERGANLPIMPGITWGAACSVPDIGIRGWKNRPS